MGSSNLAKNNFVDELPGLTALTLKFTINLKGSKRMHAKKICAYCWTSLGSIFELLFEIQQLKR